MNIDPRWDHFHNFRQLSPAGISFIQQCDLLDETVRGQGRFFILSEILFSSKMTKKIKYKPVKRSCIQNDLKRPWTNILIKMKD